MKVSLCMIVKDAEDSVEAALESVAGLVDEIVVVDTGSTDRTPEIVKEYANVYEEREWKGFADARNRAQELATGDAILILDSDERIVIHQEWEKAKELLREGADGIAFLLHNVLPKEQLLQADRLWQVRMFLNEPWARWTGKVHNQITHKLKENPRDGESAQFHQVKVMIEHKGYALDPELMKEKYERRMPDLLREIEVAKSPGIKAYYQFQASVAYFMLRDQEKSLEYALACDLSQLTGENRYSVALMAVHSCHTLKRFEEAEEWAFKMLEQRPGEVMSFLMVGLTLLHKKKFKGAYSFLGSCLALLQLKGMDYKYLLDAEYIAGAAGEAALGIKRFGEAKELFQMHLSKYQTESIAKLEAAIIPVEEARRRGLMVEEEAGPPPRGVVEGEIPDLRKTG